MNKKLYIGMVGILSLMMVGCNKSLAKVNDVEITKEQYKKTKAVLSATNNYINGQSLDELEKTLDKKGASALGFTDVGEIEVGQKADIVLYDMQKPYWYPRHDRVSLLVYAASATDADTVIVNGKVLMKNGELLEMDVEKIYAEANMRGHRLTR